MSDTEEGASEFANIFGGNVAQASRIPEDLRPILLERWAKLRQELDSSRPKVSEGTQEDTETPAPDLGK